MLPATTIIALLSLAAALSWGAGDFSGGIASRKTNVYAVVMVAYAVGLALNIIFALLLHDPWPGWTSIAWGAAAGLSGGIGLASLYRSLAIGTMGINAPVASVVTGILPVAFTFLTLGLPKPSQLAGFVLALIAIWLIAMPSGDIGRPKGLGLAILAGVGFSGFLLFIKFAGSTAKFWPMVSARATSLILVGLFALLTHQDLKPARSALSASMICGFFDSFGNLLFILAAARGRLDIAAVLSSLYPGSTLILARVFLKERIARLQTFGIALALISVALIAL